MKYSVFKVLRSGREEWRADFKDYHLARASMVFIFTSFDSPRNRYRLKDEDGNVLDEIKAGKLPEDLWTKKEP